MEVTVILLGFPEGSSRCLWISWQHKDIIMSNSMDLPVLCPQGKNISYRCLPDELLIEFTDSGIGLLMAKMEIPTVRYDATGKVERLQSSTSPTHRVVEATDRNEGF